MKISTTQVRTYQRCREEHRFAYLLRIRPVTKDEALAFGSAIHECLEQFWLGGDWRVALGGIEDPYERAKCEALMIGYEARWPKPSGVVAVEKTFALDRDGFVLVGKVDALAARG